MTVAASLALWLLAAAPAERAAAEPPMFVMRDKVASAAFDPSKYFADEEIGIDLIHIIYRGDDYGWPFYAIAIRNDCGKARTETCTVGRRARMVKVPVKADDRPRRSGSTFVHQVMQQSQTDADIPNTLDKGGLQWVETDLKTCPGAMDVLAEAGKAQWVLKSTIAPSASDEFRLVMHADIVTVTFDEVAHKSTHSGSLREGTPAAWADKLAKTLEPCWKPATAPAPWRQ